MLSTSFETLKDWKRVSVDKMISASEIRLLRSKPWPSFETLSRLSRPRSRSRVPPCWIAHAFYSVSSFFLFLFLLSDKGPSFQQNCWLIFCWNIFSRTLVTLPLLFVRFRSPLNALGGMGGQYNMDDMDMDDTNIDIVDNIDVRQILGLTEDFLPQTQQGNFWAWRPKKMSQNGKEKNFIFVVFETVRTLSKCFWKNSVL